MPSDTVARTPLAELARVFLKLGTISFGGPAAHIAMMEDEVVVRRGWLTREEFLDYVGATNLIPGPNSTELAIHVGHARAGWPGLLVAGAAFILPAACIVFFLAWGYVRFGALPSVVQAFAGVKPVVIAIVVQALWRLARTAVRSTTLAVIGALAIVATLAGVNELLVLAGGGLSAVALSMKRSSGLDLPRSLLVFSALQAVAVPSAAAIGLWPLFGVFLKIGSVLFGSGYVLLAFLRADLVDRLHWITQQQLLDAVAVGQITPGPVFTTATFVGYLVAGGRGAVVATIGIFLPAFFFVAVSGPLVPRIRRSPIAGAALDGINVASLALMSVVTWVLARSAVVDLPTALLAIVSVILLLRYRMNAAWIVAGGALAGIVVSWLR